MRKQGCSQENEKTNVNCLASRGESMSEREKFDHEYEQTLIGLGIPPCPRILLGISEQVRKSEPDLQVIEKLISEDVGLSAALIKTVNSPFYGLRNKVCSIMQAIHMLGLSQLSLMVTAMVLRDVLKGLSKVDMGRFWDASTKVAIISAYIASRLPYIVYEKKQRTIDKDLAYTYGLFQDCGIPIMLNEHATYKETLGIANQSLTRKFTAIEDEAYGQNHATVGYLLSKSWGLPEIIYQAMQAHHEHVLLEQDAGFISAESRDLIAVSLLAERIIQLSTGLNQTCEWQKGERWVMQHLGINDIDFATIVKGIRILQEEGNLSD
jgi:HD-like signal output (HDOD) protein